MQDWAWLNHNDCLRDRVVKLVILAAVDLPSDPVFA